MAVKEFVGLLLVIMFVCMVLAIGVFAYANWPSEGTTVITTVP